MGEFILPYAAVQQSENQEEMLLTFLRSTYARGAKLANCNTGLYKKDRDFMIIENTEPLNKSYCL